MSRLTSKHRGWAISAAAAVSVLIISMVLIIDNREPSNEMEHSDVQLIEDNITEEQPAASNSNTTSSNTQATSAAVPKESATVRGEVPASMKYLQMTF